MHKLVQRFEHHLTLNNGVLAIAVIITASWVWGTINAIEKNFLLEQRAEDLQQQVTVQKLQNQNLQYQQHYLQTNEYLELSAREHFDKVTPGENELILPPNTVSSPPPKTTAAIPTKQRSNVDQWLFFLLANKSPVRPEG